MSEFKYMDPNYDISSIQCFDNIDGLKDISCYLDFGIKSTIHKQKPIITPYAEKYYAKIILNNYMNGDNNSFTSQNGIRKNITTIGRDKIKNLLIKMMIEKTAYNQNVLRQLIPQDLQGKQALDVTEIARYGQLDDPGAIEWIRNNLKSFIDIYVEEYYGLDYEVKTQREELCYSDPSTTKALEQLNLQNSLNRIRK